MRIFSYLILILSLVACSNPSPNILTIGTIAGPETDIVDAAKQVAEDKYGLTIKLVEFNDYNLPNEALQEGSLDANVYQHLPYLQAAIETHGYKFQAIGRTFVYPMGIYSKKIKSLDKLRYNAIVAIPNDPSNEARALLLLEKAQLISLKTTHLASIKDIEKNPKKLQIKEMDAAQLPRVLPDVDLAIINTTFALPAGLSPMRDALFTEGKDSPYANIIVIRSNTKKRHQLEQFVKSLNSAPVKQKAKSLFGDAAIPAR